MSVNILVMDSGMGGLDVAARLFEKFDKERLSACIDFVNVRPKFGGRFEDDISIENKLSILRTILGELREFFSVDILVVACNSLSVLLKKYGCHEDRAAAIFITDFGAEEFCRFAEPADAVYVFGTDLTIESGIHKKQFIQHGIPAHKIVAQTCPGLANNIQDDYESKTTELLIEAYVKCSLKKIRGESARIFLACSHYHYVSKQFCAVFRENGCNDVRVFESNEYMADMLKMQIENHPEIPVTGNLHALNIRIHTKHEVTKTEQNNLIQLMNPISPTTALALSDIRLLPG